MAIRELTKSLMSFSWAMTIFPLQQTLNLLQPSKAAHSFDQVTEATKGELSDALESAFKAGDNLQRGMVDLTFGALTLQALNPNTFVKAASDATQRVTRAAAEATQRATQATASAAEEAARATCDATTQTARATAEAARHAAGERRSGTGK